MEDQEPGDDDTPIDLLSPDEDDEGAPLVHDWLGAIGQMVAAFIAVFALVALFIGATVGFRWLLP